jgi:NADH dehydrogenase
MSVMERAPAEAPAHSGELDVVTGAFGYTGKYITQRLLDAGRRVRTITGHPDRENPFGGLVEVEPMDFSDRAKLVRSLRGAEVLYNTYWVRFNHGHATFDAAVVNSRALISAAKEAGIRHIVHLSIANPSLDSPLAYYAGKAQVEKAIVESGLSYAILRPTVIFGEEDILINNIAWFARLSPVFAIPGDGQYRLQPIFVEDLAALATQSAQQDANLVIDAVGPEIFTFEDLVGKIAAAVGAHPRLVHASPSTTYHLLRIAGPFLGDVILTREEIAGLMGNLLISSQPAAGQTRFMDWLQRSGPSLGRRYSSELQRHF